VIPNDTFEESQELVAPFEADERIPSSDFTTNKTRNIDRLEALNGRDFTRRCPEPNNNLLHDNVKHTVGGISSSKLTGTPKRND
jgi:hypothetical protein